MESKIIWQPQWKQRVMQSRSEYEALYGGAAGGGKSDYLVAEALRQVHKPKYRAIIFRKTVKELEDIINRSYEIYKPAYKNAKYNQTSRKWSFPSGAKIYFGNMQHLKDRKKYQGRAFDFIGFDELTHFAEEEYMYMFSRCRASGPGMENYIRATANPGGVGHAWVKARFISIADPETTVEFVVKVNKPNGEQIEITKDRIFIPSSVFDNEILMQNSPEYIASLAMLPEAERQALLYGDWNSFEGQAFEEWRNDEDGYRTKEWSHVIHDFEIPKNWEILRSYDFGFSKPFSVGWHAVDETGTFYRIAELYGCKAGQANIGTKDDPYTQACRIRDIETSNPNLMHRRIIGVADPSIFERSRGESIADIMAKAQVYWDPADNERIAGKMQLHYRLAFDQFGKAKYYVFKSCKEFIRTFPTLVYDEKKVEDIDTTQEDHIYDETRYAVMTRIIAPRQNIKKEIQKEDPLNQRPKIIRI